MGVQSGTMGVNLGNGIKLRVFFAGQPYRWCYQGGQRGTPVNRKKPKVTVIERAAATSPVVDEEAPQEPQATAPPAQGATASEHEREVSWLLAELIRAVERLREDTLEANRASLKLQRCQVELLCTIATQLRQGGRTSQAPGRSWEAILADAAEDTEPT